MVAEFASWRASPFEAAVLALALLMPAPGPAAAEDTTPAAPAAATAPRGHNVLTWPIYVKWDFEDGSALRMLGPVSLSWRTRNVKSHYLLFPTTGLRRFTTGRTDLRLAWPLTDYVRDPSRGYTGLHLAGRLLGYERRADGRERSLRLSPLYTNLRAASGARTFELAPLVFRRENPNAGERVREFGFIPLFGGNGLALHRSWASGDARGWNAALIFGGRKDASTRRLWLTPYFSADRFSGPGSPARFRAFFPLYATWSSPGYRWWDAALVFGGGRGANASWLSAPPWISYDRATGANAPASLRSLVPFFASWHTPQGRWWSVALAYSGGRTAGYSWLAAPPYFSQARTSASGEASRFRTLVPVFAAWNLPRRNIGIALPSLWRYRSERMSASGAWPLYAWFRREGGDSLGRPGVRSRGHAGGSVAWPLITWGWGEGYSALGILPLYYRLRDGESSTTLAPPLYATFRRPDLDGRIVVPFYLRWWQRSDSLEAITLFYRRWNPRRRVQGFYPLQERLRTATMRREYLFPFYYHRKDGAGEQTLIFPVTADWRSTADGRSTQFFGPLVFTRGNQSRGFGIVPIYYSGSGPSGSASLLGPAFWSRGADGSRRLVVAPLAWYSHDSDATDLHLLPLTGYQARGARRFFYVLWPLYTRRVSADGSRRASLLFWLGRDETRGERRRAWLQPLVYYDRTSLERSYMAMLGGVLCSYEREGATRKLKVLMIPVRTWGK